MITFFTTASYIVLIILAGPGLMDPGIPLLTARMIVFWYSQDANVTHPAGWPWNPLPHRESPAPAP